MSETAQNVIFAIMNAAVVLGGACIYFFGVYLPERKRKKKKHRAKVW